MLLITNTYDFLDPEPLRGVTITNCPDDSSAEDTFDDFLADSGFPEEEVESVLVLEGDHLERLFQTSEVAEVDGE